MAFLPSRALLQNLQRDEIEEDLAGELELTNLHRRGRMLPSRLLTDLDEVVMLLRDVQARFPGYLSFT